MRFRRINSRLQEWFTMTWLPRFLSSHQALVAEQLREGNATQTQARITEETTAIKQVIARHDTLTGHDLKTLLA